MKRIRTISVVVFAALLILSVSSVQAQTPGQVPVFNQPGTGTCNNAGGNDCIDSVITQSSGNIGIGTTSPTAKLDVAGNLNLENSTTTSGNILKSGVVFLSNYGVGNTFIGIYAGNLTMTGDTNTGIGGSALGSNTTGFYNTANGGNALVYNTTGFYNTATGGSALLLNGMGNRNTADGNAALANNTTGSYNTASGEEALLTNRTGDYNTAIGQFADVSAGDLTNATAIGAGAIVNASNKIRLGNTAVTVVEGPPYSTVSDKNAKENFKPVDAEGVLRKIRAMSVTSWNYVGQDSKQFRHYGPVAQDFFAAFGDDGVGTIGSPTTITSTDVNGVLMLAVQALGRENAKLKERVEALERLVTRTAK